MEEQVKEKRRTISKEEHELELNKRIKFHQEKIKVLEERKVDLYKPRAPRSRSMSVTKLQAIAEAAGEDAMKHLEALLELVKNKNDEAKQELEAQPDPETQDPQNQEPQTDQETQPL